MQGTLSYLCTGNHLPSAFLKPMHHILLAKKINISILQLYVNVIFTFSISILDQSEKILLMKRKHLFTIGVFNLTHSTVARVELFADCASKKIK